MVAHHDTIKPDPFAVLMRGLVFFLPLVLVVLGLLYRMYLQQVEYETDVLKGKESVYLELQCKGVEDVFKSVASDLLFVAELGYAEYILEGADEQTWLELGHVLLNLAKEKKWYSALCLVDKQGMELMRVNSVDGKVEMISDKRLIDRSNARNYKNVLAMAQGEVFVSRMWRVKNPVGSKTSYRTEVRFSTPLRDESGKLLGVLIFHFHAETLLNRIRMLSAQSPGKTFLVDKNGVYLLSPATGEISAENEEEVPRRWFRKDYPLVWESILKADSGQLIDNKGLFTFGTILSLNREVAEESRDPGQFLWKFISFASVGKSSKESGLFQAYVMLALVFVVMIAAGAYTLAQEQESRKAALKMLTRKVDRLSRANVRTRRATTHESGDESGEPGRTEDS